MGLKERRAAQGFQEGKYAELKNAIDAACGFNINMDVDWDSLAIEGWDHMYEDAFPKIYFNPILDAFKQIGADDMGKEALKAGIKSVKIENKNGRGDPSGITFSDGVLTIDHKPNTNLDDVQKRTDKIVSIIESAL